MADTHHTFAILLLAAGTSSRMGNTNKLLAPIHHMPLITHTLSAFTKALPHAPCVVVTGFEHLPIETAIKALALPHIQTLYNPDFIKGQYHSVYRGIQHLNTLSPIPTHVLVSVADIPFLSSSCITHLVAKSQRNPKKILIPTFQGKRGHPCVFPLTALKHLPPPSGNVQDHGLKPLFAQSIYPCNKVPMPHPGSILDIDTAKDLNAAEVLLENPSFYKKNK